MSSTPARATTPSSVATIPPIGNDSILATTGADLILGNGGGDTISGGTGNNTLIGGFGADSIVAASGVSLGFGNEGNDTIGISTGTVWGGQSDDSITSADPIGAGVLIFGGEGADRIRTGNGNNTVYGGTSAANSSFLSVRNNRL